MNRVLQMSKALKKKNHVHFKPRARVASCSECCHELYRFRRFVTVRFQRLVGRWRLWRVLQWKSSCSCAFRSPWLSFLRCFYTFPFKTCCAIMGFSNGFWSAYLSRVPCSTPTVWAGTTVPVAARYTCPYWEPYSTWPTVDGFTGRVARTTGLPVGSVKTASFERADHNVSLSVFRSWRQSFVYHRLVWQWKPDRQRNRSETGRFYWIGHLAQHL